MFELVSKYYNVLGVGTISNIINKIPNFNINNIPLDDNLVYELFCNAETDGIFQFETKSFQMMLTKYNPRNFNELVASIALVRPGPIRELETYIKRKNGLEKITYYHESLKDILINKVNILSLKASIIKIFIYQCYL